MNAQLLQQLTVLDTCTVSNAIEALDTRLRNEGFTDRTIRRITGGAEPLVGHAVPLRIRCARPPMRGRAYADRTDLWNYVLSIPAPRVVVIQDLDPEPGLGTFLGGVHSSILAALGCVGGITNGSVRDVPAVEQAGFQLFAKGLSVSHAYAHIVDFGMPVEIGGLKVHPSALLHADLHGVLCVPDEIATEIPSAAARIRAHERALVELCRSPDFTLEKLREAVTAF